MSLRPPTNTTLKRKHKSNPKPNSKKAKPKSNKPEDNRLNKINTVIVSPQCAKQFSSKDKLNDLYSQMVSDGFFNSLNKFTGVNSNKKPSTNWTGCEDRSKIEEYKTNELGMKFYITPCRILGRYMDLCWGKIRDGDGVAVKPAKKECVLCATIHNCKKSPCDPFNKIQIVTYTVKHSTTLATTLVLLPNAFPYLPNHWLITTNNQGSDHHTQYDITEIEILKSLGSICEELCIEPNDTIFFTGMAGNSLEHFHAHYVQFNFPIYKIIEDYIEQFPVGFIHKSCSIYFLDKEQKWVTCLVLRCTNINFLITNVLHVLLTKIEEQPTMTSNFSIHKNGVNYECILFARKTGLKGLLNYGVNELMGYVNMSSEKDYVKHSIENIKAHLDQTNNGTTLNNILEQFEQFITSSA